MERRDCNHENTEESAVRVKLWEVFVSLFKMNRRGKTCGNGGSVAERSASSVVRLSD